MTKFTVRDKSDPFLVAIGLSGDPNCPWELSGSEYKGLGQTLFTLGAGVIIILLIVAGIIIFKRRHIKMLKYDNEDDFNELESSTIKL